MDNEIRSWLAALTDPRIMPKKWLRRHLPSDETIRTHHNLRALGGSLQNPNLWHLNRRSVSGGVAVGIFWAFFPAPVQMLLAAGSAVLLRVHVPIAVVGVWITNPLTMGPLFYFAYRVGAWALNRPPTVQPFEVSWQWLERGIASAWLPLMLGCLICGVVGAALGWFVTQRIWCRQVRHQARMRARRRSGTPDEPGAP